MSHTKDLAATDQHMETVASLTIEHQLQLAAANFGGTLESKLTAAALATLVARMVKLDTEDQRALFACVRDLSTIKGREYAEDTMKTILEILGNYILDSGYPNPLGIAMGKAAR